MVQVLQQRGRKKYHFLILLSNQKNLGYSAEDERKQPVKAWSVVTVCISSWKQEYLERRRNFVLTWTGGIAL
ncbi:hypothetical protein PF006_g20747 [Phytophthora fragariae]|nr:hypothetical protein PF011_g20633 [Phytophthora fragariae]KAE9109044.1 hypothetical protein PF006_g20747 [Phytophthora fragariae]